MISKSKLWVISHLFITVLPKANIDAFRMWTTTKRRYSNTNGDDMVIVSKMTREFSYNSTPQSKLANVYFHCNNTCVRRKQPNFQSTSIVQPSIRHHLLDVHIHHLGNIVGHLKVQFNVLYFSLSI